VQKALGGAIPATSESEGAALGLQMAEAVPASSVLGALTVFEAHDERLRAFLVERYASRGRLSFEPYLRY
jgi:hypothetical protein